MKRISFLGLIILFLTLISCVQETAPSTSSNSNNTKNQITSLQAIIDDPNIKNGDTIDLSQYAKISNFDYNAVVNKELIIENGEDLKGGTLTVSQTNVELSKINNANVTVSHSLGNGSLKISSSSLATLNIQGGGSHSIYITDKTTVQKTILNKSVDKTAANNDEYVRLVLDKTVNIQSLSVMRSAIIDATAGNKITKQNLPSVIFDISDTTSDESINLAVSPNVTFETNDDLARVLFQDNSNDTDKLEIFVLKGKSTAVIDTDFFISAFDNLIGDVNDEKKNELETILDQIKDQVIIEDTILSTDNNNENSSSSSDDSSDSTSSSLSVNDSSSSSSSDENSSSSSSTDSSSSNDDSSNCSSSSSEDGSTSSSSSDSSSFNDDSSNCSSSSSEDGSTNSSSGDSSSSSGDDSSSSASSTTTIPSIQTCATPVISGTTPFESSTIVSISCETTGANIYYTTDGSAPTTSSTQYTGSFTVSATTTVKAIAIKTEYNDSEVSEKTFTTFCADPILSVPEGDFWNEITVFVSGDDTYYYTTDGTDPTTNSTAYTSAGIDITATTTLKVLAHDSTGAKTDAVVTAIYTKQNNQSITENPSGVMLQGFTWNSAPRGTNWSEENPSPFWGKWYQTMINRADDIKDTFEYVWCPPPSKTNTEMSEGYAPTQLNDLNSYYGTAEQLQAMINAISPAKAIADIVINHRAGTNSWGDFTNPSWCEDYYAICSDDEGFSNSSSPMYGSNKKGAADTGDGYTAYRDLDHTNTAVQNGIIDWMNDVLKAAGFVGWRYDYVKGYGAQYVGKYNKETDAVFSVGEYWPSAGYSAGNPSAWGNEIKNWVSGTETNGGQRSKAFDFALKGALNNVFGYTSDGSSTSGTYNYGLLADASNLYISQPEDAVTFVDNHDTGSNQGHCTLNPAGLGAAYALILTHPGYPCVSWSHYFTFAESGSRESTYPYSGITASSSYLASNPVSGSSMGLNLRQHIDYLIGLRKNLGIEYNSERTTIEATNTHYVAQISGSKGSLIVEIGSGWNKPSSYSDYEIDYYGNNFTIYTNDTSKCKAPTISISNDTCSISCATTGATIYYKINSGNYTTYTSAFTVTEGQTVYAYATADGLGNSSIVIKTYSTAVTLYFVNNMAWEQVYVYFFNNSNQTVGSSWPGTAMIWSYDNEYAEGVFTITVPTGANYVVFNNNVGTQTVDIPLTGSDTNYYISGGSGNSCTVGTW